MRCSVHQELSGYYSLYPPNNVYSKRIHKLKTILLFVGLNMLHILNLFGRSPFAPLQEHMEKVTSCVHELLPLFQALQEKNHTLVGKIAEKISHLEHAADLTKNDIRNHLPGNLFL